MNKIKLYEIAEVSAGQGAPQGDNEYSDIGTPFVKAGNLLDLVNGLSIDSIQKVTEDTANKYKLKKFQKGTVVFAKSGMSCMKGYVYTLPIDAYVVNHLACIIPYKNTSDYLKYYFMYHKPSELVKDSSYPSIRLSDISDIELRLPKENEIDSIVRTLELISRIIKNKAQVLSEYDQLIKSRFVEMFEQDLQGKSIRLGDITEVITKGTTPTTLGFDFVEDGVNFVKVECITETGKFIKEKMLHINEECNGKLKRSVLKKDDILFSIAGAIGRTAIVTDDILPANTNQALSIIRLRKDTGLNVEFLSQVLKTDLITEQIGKRVNGVAQMNVSLADIGNLQIIRPTINRQNDFAQFVQQVDKLEFEVQKSLDQTQMLFDSLMQEYFG